jgi:ABC-type Fe3+/spermidine/putrescine transport system ATPase subunit
VFQDPLLFPHLTVAGNVGFGLRMRGLPAARIAEKVEAMLARVQLSGFGARRPADLSGGQAQRVALARALVLRPDLLLLDEPLSSLDPALRAEMQALIRTLQRDMGVTTLVVTHDQAEAVALADRIALVLQGRIAQADTAEALYRRPASLPVARFFGPTNLIPGRMERGRFLSPLGPLAIAPDQIAGAATGDGPATLTLRPEALVLGPGPQGLSATVGQATFLGTQARVTLAVNGLELQALVTPDQARALAPGQAVGLTLPPAALWVLPGADLASPAASVS